MRSPSSTPSQRASTALQGLRAATPSTRYVVHSTAALTSPAYRRPSPQNASSTSARNSAATPVAAPRQRRAQVGQPEVDASRIYSRSALKPPWDSCRRPLSSTSATKARPSPALGPASPQPPPRPVAAPRTTTAARASNSAVTKSNDDFMASPASASWRRQPAPHRQAPPRAEAPRPMPRKAYPQQPQQPAANVRRDVQVPPQWARPPATRSSTRSSTLAPPSPFTRANMAPGRPADARRAPPPPSRAAKDAPRVYKAPVPPPPYAPPLPPQRTAQQSIAPPPKNVAVVVKKEPPPPPRTLLEPRICTLRLGRGPVPVPCCTSRCPVPSHSPPRTQVEAPCGGLHRPARTPQRAPAGSSRREDVSRLPVRKTTHSQRSVVSGPLVRAPAEAVPPTPRRLRSATRRLRRGLRRSASKR